MITCWNKVTCCIIWLSFSSMLWSLVNQRKKKGKKTVWNTDSAGVSATCIGACETLSTSCLSASLLCPHDSRNISPMCETIHSLKEKKKNNKTNKQSLVIIYMYPLFKIFGPICWIIQHDTRPGLPLIFELQPRLPSLLSSPSAKPLFCNCPSAGGVGRRPCAVACHKVWMSEQPVPDTCGVVSCLDPRT